MPVPFSVRHIDHIVLRAQNVEGLKEFYVRVIGCSVERIAGKLTQLRAGSALIDLVPREVGDPGGCNVDHICLAVAPFDITEIDIWLNQNGVRSGEAASRYGSDGHGMSVYLTDPEGNGLELRGNNLPERTAKYQ